MVEWRERVGEALTIILCAVLAWAAMSYQGDVDTAVRTAEVGAP